MHVQNMQECYFPLKKALRGAPQHRTGLLIYVICVIKVIKVIKVINAIHVYVNLRKLDSGFNKMSSHNLPYKRIEYKTIVLNISEH